MEDLIAEFGLDLYDFELPQALTNGLNPNREEDMFMCALRRPGIDWVTQCALIDRFASSLDPQTLIGEVPVSDHMRAHYAAVLKELVLPPQYCTKSPIDDDDEDDLGDYNLHNG